VVSVNDFFRWGIRIGFRLFEKPHKKNKEVTKTKANPVFETVLIATSFGSDVFIAYTFRKIG
jgi:hypothetical protein